MKFIVTRNASHPLTFIRLGLLIFRINLRHPDSFVKIEQKENKIQPSRESNTTNGECSPFVFFCAPPFTRCLYRCWLTWLKFVLTLIRVTKENVILKTFEIRANGFVAKFIVDDTAVVLSCLVVVNRY